MKLISAMFPARQTAALPATVSLNKPALINHGEQYIMFTQTIAEQEE